MKNLVVTISREFGSGGREIGKRLADVLGIKYVDREVVETIAKETNLDESFVQDKLEKGITNIPVHFACSFARITQVSNSAMLIAKQHQIIKEIASKNDCIIVGRGADAALTDIKPFKIFVYADKKSKIERCKQRMKKNEILTDKELEYKIKNIDKARKATHNLYAAYTWGDKVGYNLCINTTYLNIKDIVFPIANIIKNYYKED